MQNSEDQLYFCNLCSKQAFFMCSNCQEVAYCKLDHQKADRINHKSNCISRIEKQKQHIRQRQNFRSKIMAKLAKKQYIDCEVLSHQLTKIQRDNLKKFPKKQNQLEYGAALLFQVRLMIIVKDYNQAQEILNSYINEKNKFISDTSDIPNKLDAKDPQYQNKKAFVLGKFRLISTIANLTHQLIRNSIHIIQILVEHVQKFYGSESIQLSNCYFQAGLYYNFMNQGNKAAACFLKAGKMRKQQGGTCFYNAALTMAYLGQQGKAFQFFQLAHKTIKQNEANNRVQVSLQLKANIFQNLGIYNCKIDNFDQGVRYLQSAMCLFQTSAKESYARRIKNIRNVLQVVKAINEDEGQDLGNYKLNQLPHQKPKANNYAFISNNDFQLFWHGQKPSEEQQKYEIWAESFKQYKKKFQMDNIGVKPPQVVEKYLQVERQPQYREQQVRNAKQFDKKQKKSKQRQQLKINFNFMAQLSAIQVDYLNQLNENISDIKDRSGLPQFVVGSNFIKSLNKNQQSMFYHLNPNLAKQKKVNISKNENQGQEKSKTKIKTPRLDLSELNNH